MFKKTVSTYIGQQFGSLTIISKPFRVFRRYDSGDIYYYFVRCRCKCGNELDINESEIARGTHKFCSLCRKIYKKCVRHNGDIIGYLTCISNPYYIDKKGKSIRVIDTKCVCGNVKTFPIDYIGHKAKSCGLCRVFHKTHGDSKTRLYRIWAGMKDRCYNLNSQCFKYYGGKGIKILWNSFEEFRSWSHLNGYKKNLTIDRINSNGDYCSDNCEWVTS